MDYSTIHIKAPHPVHIAAKVLAANKRISMNQFVVDLIMEAMDKNAMPVEEVQAGIDSYHKVTDPMEPEEKKTFMKGLEKLSEGLVEVKDVEELAEMTFGRKEVKRCKHGSAVGLCKFGCK